MKLSFLGQSYEATIAGSPAQETEQFATFRGQRYRIKHVQVANRKASSELIYRGIHYTR